MRNRDDPAAAIAVTQAIDSLNRDISQCYFLNVSGVDQLLAQCQSSGISDIAFKICIVVNVIDIYRYFLQFLLRGYARITSATYGTSLSMIKRIFIPPIKQYIVNVNASLVMGNPMHPAPAWNIRTRVRWPARFLTCVDHRTASIYPGVRHNRGALMTLSEVGRA